MLTSTAELRRVLISELRIADANPSSAENTLNRIVVQIANGFEADVCSVYSLRNNGKDLVLVATVGLLQSCVGRLHMQTREGLVGLVAEQRAPVTLADAPQHPRFKYFPEADEDRYHSFLGVPVIGGDRLRGVLVVQTIEPRSFSTSETKELTRVARLLGRRLHGLAEAMATGQEPRLLAT